jgi:hypothetical protein
MNIPGFLFRKIAGALATLLLALNLLAISYILPNHCMAAPGMRPLPQGAQQSLIQQAVQNGQQTPVERIIDGVLFVPRLVFNNIPVVRTLENAVAQALEELTRKVWEMIRETTRSVLRPIVKGIVGHVFVLLHNPNIASPTNEPYTLGSQTMPYDLVDQKVKVAVREGFDIMRAIAINLLLLLFIASVWKYWTDAHWRHQSGNNLMGAVARLIGTMAVILFWPVISSFTIQISNEMIDYVFETINQHQLEAAVASIVDFGLVGAVAAILGGLAAGVMGVAATGPGGFLAGAAAGAAGEFLYFIFLGITLYMGASLVVLKAVQTGLMMAQFMFAPFFLMFFATQDTEDLATGFVRSCIEVSLWTFIWAGLLRLIVIVLVTRFEPWGQFLMLLGVMQIMLHVPEFLGKARISPVSDFLSPRGVMRGVGAVGLALGVAAERTYENYKKKNPPQVQKTPHNAGPNVPPLANPPNAGPQPGGPVPPPKGPPVQAGGPQAQAGAPPGQPGAPPGQPGASQGQPGASQGQPGASPGQPGGPPVQQGTPAGQQALSSSQQGVPLQTQQKQSPDHHGKQGSLPDVAETFARGLKRKQISTTSGKGFSTTNGVDGRKLVQYDENATDEQKTAFDAAVGMASLVDDNSEAMDAAKRAAGRPARRFRSNPGLENQQRELNARGAADKGALAYWNGEEGNAFTAYLRSKYGERIPDQMRRDLMEKLGDASLAHSPLNSNYDRSAAICDSAGAPRSAGNMAAASHAALSRVHPSQAGEALQAVRDLAQALDPSARSESEIGSVVQALPRDLVSVAVDYAGLQGASGGTLLKATPALLRGANSLKKAGVFKDHSQALLGLNAAGIRADGRGLPIDADVELAVNDLGKMHDAGFDTNQMMNQDLVSEARRLIQSSRGLEGLQEAAGVFGPQEAVRYAATVEAMSNHDFSRASRQNAKVIKAVSRLPDAIKNVPGKMAAAARAADIYTVYEFTGDAEGCTNRVSKMVDDWGWSVGSVGKADVENAHAIDRLSNHTVDPTPTFVDRLVKGNVLTAATAVNDPTIAQFYLGLSGRPELAHLRPHELLPACDANYKYASADPTFSPQTAPSILANLDTDTIGACVAVGKIRGSDMCGDRTFVDQVAATSSRSRPQSPKGGIATNVGGAQYYVSW